MKLDLESLERHAGTAVGFNLTIGTQTLRDLIELVKRQERELTAARAAATEPFGYISEASAAMTGKRAMGVRSDPTEASPVPIYLAAPAAQAAPVVAASELSDEQIDTITEDHSTGYWLNNVAMREFARAVLAAATPAASELERAVLDMARMLAANEWAEHVSDHPAAAALESEITRLVGRLTPAVKERAQYERMFLAACDDLAAIADDLGIDSHIEGGAAPILREIAALRAAAPAVQQPAEGYDELIGYASQSDLDRLRNSDDDGADLPLSFAEFDGAVMVFVPGAPTQAEG